MRIFAVKLLATLLVTGVRGVKPGRLTAFQINNPRFVVEHVYLSDWQRRDVSVCTAQAIEYQL